MLTWWWHLSSRILKERSVVTEWQLTKSGKPKSQRKEQEDYSPEETDEIRENYPETDVLGTHKLTSWVLLPLTVSPLTLLHLLLQQPSVGEKLFMNLVLPDSSWLVLLDSSFFQWTWRCLHDVLRKIRNSYGTEGIILPHCGFNTTTSDEKTENIEQLNVWPRIILSTPWTWPTSIDYQLTKTGFESVLSIKFRITMWLEKTSTVTIDRTFDIRLVT